MGATSTSKVLCLASEDLVHMCTSDFRHLFYNKEKKYLSFKKSKNIFL
jgi:hypothetical protein